MLERASTGFGMLALAGLAGAEPPAGARPPHFPPKVKHVIFCYMSGGCSHIDSFDPKPRLAQRSGPSDADAGGANHVQPEREHLPESLGVGVNSHASTITP